MNRFGSLFEARDRKAVIPFFMLGDPDPDACLRIVDAALAAGADALELGIPFSDPLADGPVIQRSALRALEAGTTVERCFELLGRIRAGTEVPIGLLVYYNLIHRKGVEEFCDRVAAAGADAILAADLPIEESGPLEVALAARDLGCAQLVAPNTPDERAREIARRCTAFTYVVSTFGTTGAREHLEADTCHRVTRLRATCDGPLAVGFGISRPDQAGALFAAGADGVIVGSALIRILEENRDDVHAAADAVGRRIRQFREQEVSPSC